MKLVTLLCTLAVFAGALNAQADWGRPGPGPGRPGPGWDNRGPGRPGPGYGGPGHGGPGWGRPIPRFYMQYDGQRPGPAGGSPYGYNYCGTENMNMQQCGQPGFSCYINSGYYWNGSQNMFNIYTCR